MKTSDQLPRAERLIREMTDRYHARRIDFDEHRARNVRVWNWAERNGLTSELSRRLRGPAPRSVRSGNVELRPVPGKDADDVIIF